MHFYEYCVRKAGKNEKRPFGGRPCVKAQFRLRRSGHPLLRKQSVVLRFHQAAARAERQLSQVALLFLDLDGFKNINDALGHAAGDKLLKQVASRLTECIRTSDTACRYGGDEFAVLLPELEHHDSAMAVAGKICTHLARPYLVDGTAIQMTTSIGIAVYPVDGNA